MRPLSSVQPLVGLQAVRVPQRFSTVAAQETSSCVGKHVATELRFLGESLVTLGAGIRLLSVVDPQMALEVPWETDGTAETETVVAAWICICPTTCENEVLSHNWCCHFDKWKHKLLELITAGDAGNILSQCYTNSRLIVSLKTLNVNSLVWSQQQYGFCPSQLKEHVDIWGEICLLSCWRSDERININSLLVCSVARRLGDIISFLTGHSM